MKSSAVLILFLLLMFSAPASAEITAYAELSGSYTDNVQPSAQESGATTGSGGDRGGRMMSGALYGMPWGGMGGGMGSAGSSTQSDFIATIAASVGTQHAMGDTGNWFAALDVRSARYSSTSELSSLSVGARLGARRAFTETVTGSLQLSASQKSYDESSYDEQTYGLGVQVQEAMWPALVLGQFAQVSQVSPDGGDQYDTYKLGLRAGWMPDEANTFWMAAAHLWENYDAYTYRALEFTASVDRQLNEHVGMYLEYNRHEPLSDTTGMSEQRSNTITVGASYAY